ncbi:E3 ubiquitin-protein ligase RNF38-like isoform X3 [Lineus longissimus]|uniref:E3 ubiquitin-protein ligase RNF38-like isoform X3 n=1 Tax=Lineus longissimus TaxID=88925 RepID=UPI002B4DA975
MATYINIAPSMSHMNSLPIGHVGRPPLHSHSHMYQPADSIDLHSNLNQQMQHSPQFFSGIITEDSGRKSESPTRKRRKLSQNVIDLTTSPSPPPVGRTWPEQVHHQVVQHVVDQNSRPRRRSTTQQRRISTDRCNTPRGRGSPGTRRRMRDRHPSNRQTESPERRAFQPPNMAARQVHPQLVPQPQQPQPRPQQQQQQHPVVIDVEQVNRRVPVSAPVSVPPYAIPVCSGQHHIPIPVCTTAHIPGCTSQPTWSIPACSMQIPCSIQHLPPCGLTQLPVGHHTLPPMLHPHHHPTTHPMQAHHHPHQQLHHQHHHMTPTTQLLSQTHQVQPEEEVQQMLGEHRPGHPTYHQHLSNTIHQHHGPTLSHPSPVLVQEPQIHPPPYPHELYGPYPRYPRRTTGRSRWRSIPPPPPPYPGFLLHFLAMLGNPPVPGTIGMDLHEDAREVENYEALLNLAERLGEAKPRGLTKSDIDKLPSYRFNPEMQRSDADQTSCVVCMCDFEVRQLLRVLPCSHEFHAKCVDKWLKTNRTCPICRADASEGISQSE